ncbi:MAG: PVC-type heme-binding CxxCH protein [Fimbriiglobus sp.]
MVSWRSAGFGFVVLCLGWLVAADRPLPTDKVASAFKVPKGFNVTLFAGEPAVVQPIAFTFDDRGRMWVVECLSYPKWRADGKGNDRVIIFEDTDGDGVHDKRTVVLDNGSNLSGIELGFGGMYLCSTPNFLFVPLKDDKPAGEPVVLLDGWNLKEAKHNVFNGLAWGPDGWLYGTNGIQTRSYVGKPGTPQDKRTFFDCGIWRYHPREHKFEIHAVGMTNPWGVDWDDLGEMFVTNCVIDHLWHIVPGGRYQRMYGQDPNPHSYGHMASAVDYKHWGNGHWTDSRADRKTGAVPQEHDLLGGGHAHSGIAIMLGENFPKEYRNSLFTCNIHGNRINRDGLARTSSGMKGVRQPDFAFANDPWFRGVAVKQGPEGALYAADWSDTGECHNYDVADVTNGRIVRIAYGTPKPWRGDIDKMSNEELMAAQSSENEWLLRRARLKLQERYRLGDGIEEPLREQLNHPDPRKKLRALWALDTIGVKLSPIDAMLFLLDPSEAVRVGAIRTLGPKVLQKVNLEYFGQQRSPFVRGALADALRRLPAKDRKSEHVIRLEAAQALFSHPEDNTDAKLTLQYWLGIEESVANEPKLAMTMIKAVAIDRIQTNTIRRILTLPGTKPTEQLAFVLLAFDDTRPAYLANLLQGVQDAFEGRTDIVAPQGWAEVMTRLTKLNDAKLSAKCEDISVLVGDFQAIATIRARMMDESAKPEARARAIQQLVSRKTLDLAKDLRILLKEPTMRSAAIRGLAAYPDVVNAEAILGPFNLYSPSEKEDALQTLASRPAFASVLLDRIAKGEIRKTEINAFTARQIVGLNQPKITAQLKEVWGEIRPASANRVEQTKRLKGVLTADTLKAADLKNGRKLYATNCASCHKLFDDGQAIGPELTGAQRTSLDYVLENVLDPSAVVPSDYRMVQFQMLDGRTVSGVIRKETPQTVTVRTLNEELILAVADIDARKTTGISLMPDGLFDKLTDNEIRDLVGYLASPVQVAKE